MTKDGSRFSVVTRPLTAQRTNGEKVLFINEDKGMQDSDKVSQQETPPPAPFRISDYVRPNDIVIKTSDPDRALAFGNAVEKQNRRTADNVLRALQQFNHWTSFTFAEFKELSAPRKVLDVERNQLDDLVKAGVLGKTNNTYVVGPSLIWFFSKDVQLGCAA